jgi:hypothetical protein
MAKRFGLTDAELEKLIRSQAEVDAGINEFMAKTLVPAARAMAASLGAVDTGAYAASIKVSKKARNGVGMVTAGRFTAAFIEYGTGEPGPTKAFGVMERTAQQFGGHIATAEELKELKARRGE